MSLVSTGLPTASLSKADDNEVNFPMNIYNIFSRYVRETPLKILMKKKLLDINLYLCNYNWKHSAEFQIKTSFQCSMIILSSIFTVDVMCLLRKFRAVERVVVFIIVASVRIPRLGQLQTCQGEDVGDLYSLKFPICRVLIYYFLDTS